MRRLSPSPGTVAPGTPLNPDAIAATFLALHKQPRQDWQTEVVFNGEGGR